MFRVRSGPEQESLPPLADKENALRERIRIVAEQTVARGWGLLKATTFAFQRRTGEWQTLRRETYDCGHGAAVLPYDPARGTVLLIRQFRFPAFYNGEDGFLIEVPAGKLDADDPEACARKEAEEETGYAISDLHKVTEAYASPGSVTEKLTLFTARYDAGSRVAAGGGLVEEGEDIEVLEIGLPAALDMIASGAIADAKTIILLQHLALKGLTAV